MDRRDLNPEELFRSHLERIDQIIQWICRRRCLKGADAEDFGSWVKLRLIDNDYRVIRKFQGRSSFPTFITTVIHNLARDFQVQKWGKWRPSAVAKRLGEEAIQLETLVYRDGFSLAEASEMLQANWKVSASRTELAEMFEQLPQKTNRRIEGEESLATLANGPAPDDRLSDSQRASALMHAEEALGKALTELCVEDRLILKMRYQDGLAIATIARTLQLNQRQLYTRVHKCLAQLRVALEQQGVKSSEVLEGVGWSGADLQVEIAPPALELEQSSPSIEGGSG